jgi:putative acetyltransferase
LLTIGQVSTAAEIAAIGDLLREFTAWAFALDPASDVAPTFEGLEEELASLPGIYAPPAGRLLLATWDGDPVGSIALKPHDETVAELKRLYVRPSARGHAIGRHLVERLIAEARTCGYQRFVLDSYHTMTRAHALYEAAGFRSVPAPDDFPEQLKPVVVFMGMDLRR